MPDGTEVGVKVLAQPKDGGFREEVEVLSKFRHPNLVILMGLSRHKKVRLLIYEYLSGGDLCSRIQKSERNPFLWRDRLSVAIDTSLGLSHLHSHRPPVFHRDIKTQNILLDKNGSAKLADFGLAVLAQANQSALRVKQTSGTIGYADPLYIRTSVVNEKSEVYSMGMVLLELLCGKPPALQHSDGRIVYTYDHLKGQLSEVIKMLDSRAAWPADVAKSVGALALQCIRSTADARPQTVQVVKQLRAIDRQAKQNMRANAANAIARSERQERERRREIRAQSPSSRDRYARPVSPSPREGREVMPGLEKRVREAKSPSPKESRSPKNDRSTPSSPREVKSPRNDPLKK
jgi:serine/threonine protein kinase